MEVYAAQHRRWQERGSFSNDLAELGVGAPRDAGAVTDVSVEATSVRSIAAARGGGSGAPRGSRCWRVAWAMLPVVGGRTALRWSARHSKLGLVLWSHAPPIAPHRPPQASFIAFVSVPPPAEGSASGGGACSGGARAPGGGWAAAGRAARLYVTTEGRLGMDFPGEPGLEHRPAEGGMRWC